MQKKRFSHDAAHMSMSLSNMNFASHKFAEMLYMYISMKIQMLLINMTYFTREVENLYILFVVYATHEIYTVLLH